MNNTTKKTFDFKSVESKWAKEWREKNVYAAEDFSKKPKKYILAEFPYPSGTGLHVGHMMRYTMPDVLARKLRMSGYNVLFPIGWDAFGLPAENFAIKNNLHPRDVVKKASDNYRRVLSEVGYSFDWDREINSTDPNYYKWTQWLFLKFFENGLAELKEEPVWWSEELKTVLANEEVMKNDAGEMVPTERGKLPVERRMLKQWVLKMPKYADKLIEGLSKVDLQDSIKAAQINWIGRSEGAEIDFTLRQAQGDNVMVSLSNHDSKITVFTTRLDTIYGATFIVISPEHKDIWNVVTEENKKEVEKYVETAKGKSELERTALAKDKTGVFTGSYAINPFNQTQVPIWVSDFVVTTYGTGAIMGVPAHDDRDYDFAKKFDLPIIQVVETHDYASQSKPTSLPFIESEDNVILINSAEYNDLTPNEAFNKMIEKAEKEEFGRKKINYKLRDWLFSRQRYWGEPIPLVHKEDGTVEAIADTNNPEEVKKFLPLILPEVPDYTPSSDASSPLAKNEDWVNTTAKDGSPAKRETNTMPNWAGSCWYYLRYIDPKNDDAFADFEKMKYWLPVDMYFGGSEHTTLHLLYSRFWHKFFYDLGLVPTEEPYQWRMNGGILLGPDGEKMSKSRGNILNPDEKIAEYGADALRMYVNFMGPYDGTIMWQEGGLKACKKVIDDIYILSENVSDQENSNEVVRAMHKMIKNVSRMIDELKTNTAISEIMIFTTILKKQEFVNKDVWSQFLRIVAPFAPFITEELWQEKFGNKDFAKENSIHIQEWPKFDEALAQDNSVVIGIQIGGKTRAEIEVTKNDTEDQVKERVLAMPEVQKWIERKEIKKFIYVPCKIVNIVV